MIYQSGKFRHRMAMGSWSMPRQSRRRSTSWTPSRARVIGDLDLHRRMPNQNHDATARQNIQAPMKMMRKPATRITSGINGVSRPKRMPITQTATQARAKRPSRSVSRSLAADWPARFGGGGQFVDHGVGRGRLAPPGRPAVGGPLRADSSRRVRTIDFVGPIGSALIIRSASASPARRPRSRRGEDRREAGPRCLC